MFELDIARSIADDRIAAAERHRAARTLPRPRRTGSGGARFRVGSLVHRRPGLAQLGRPE